MAGTKPASLKAALDAARARGDLEAALARRAEAAEPQAVWPLAQRASLCHQLGRIEETIAAAAELRRRFPEESAGYHAGLSALRSRERLAEALKLARAAARRFPGEARFAAAVTELTALRENRAGALAVAAELPLEFARPKVVIVLGMHRSGSSLAAQMLQRLGVGLGGPLMPGNFANAEGYFEHLEIVGAHDAAFAQMGVGWDTCWSALPQQPRADLAGTRARLTAIAERELAANGGLWGFKDPRTLRFLPLWTEIFETLGVEPVWLLCLRDPRASAASLYARDRLPRRIGELLWIEHVTEALAELGPRLSLILPYERWFEAPQAQAEALAKAVGRPAVRTRAKAELRHQAPRDEKPALPLSMAIHAALSAPAPDLTDLQARAKALRGRWARGSICVPGQGAIGVQSLS